MSVGRMGARTALTAIGVLVSVALMAAPSWAAKGNSGNAALCEPGGYGGVLLNQQAETFKNEGQCTKAGAKRELVGVNAVAEPASGGVFFASYSGFGLKPGSTFFAGALYQPSGKSSGNHTFVVAEDGTISVRQGFRCELVVFGKVSAVVLEATTAAGTTFARGFSPPSGC